VSQVKGNRVDIGGTEMGKPPGLLAEGARSAAGRDCWEGLLGGTTKLADYGAVAWLTASGA
jgi:hypothetical protein